MRQAEENDRLALRVLIDSQDDGVIERLPGHMAWVRHRPGQGAEATRAHDERRWYARLAPRLFAKDSSPVVELWLGRPPGDPPREPDRREPSTMAAVNRVLHSRF